jgi:hypothetical protein
MLCRNNLCLFVLFYAYRFYIQRNRRMWAPCLEEELVSCVVLMFIFHDVKVPIGGWDC